MTLAFVCGCAGATLGPEERALIGDARPWGLILFERNVVDRERLPVVAARRNELAARDFAPFAALSDAPMAMGARGLQRDRSRSSRDDLADRRQGDHARGDRLRRPDPERRSVDEGAARPDASAARPSAPAVLSPWPDAGAAGNARRFRLAGALAANAGREPGFSRSSR
jgi:hypothetical protein